MQQLIKSGSVFEEDATTARTLNNIRKTTKKTLMRDYDKDLKEVDQLLSIHGLSKEDFDFVSKAEQFIRENLNDISIDDNSNKSDKAISSTMSEVSASVGKAVGYDYLYRQMVDLYGKREAKRLSGEMYSLALAISDSTKILSPYCWSLDASKIVLEGRAFGQLHSAPPKRIASYISALNETVHQMSNHLAGALAIGSFFLDISHLGIFKEKISLMELKGNAETRKYIENCYQNFIHSVNHLSRNGNESPFTNVSILDKVKIKNFIQDMSWYFDGDMFGEGKQYDEEYLIEYITEIQNIYLDFFDKGDTIHNGMPFRFPVTTVNLSIDEAEKIIEDESMLENITNRDIHKYNVFASGGSKFASCCRLLSDLEMMEVASNSNSFGGAGAISIGSHRVLTINFNRIALESEGEVDVFWDIYNQRIYDAIKILFAHKMLLKKLTKSGMHPFISMGWIDLSRLFSTVGVIGLTEAAQTMGFDGEDKKEFISDLLKCLNEEVKSIPEELKKHNEINMIINIEQIPAESMAHRLVRADKILFGDEAVPYNLYSNQFIPLWEDVTLWERMEIDGLYNKLITGGGIVHFSLGEETTQEQNIEIINYAIKSGCEHFALNAVYSVCENGHTHFGNLSKCPTCGTEKITHYTRVVGFFTPVESWNHHKREYDFKRRNYRKVSGIEFPVKEVVA